LEFFIGEVYVEKASGAHSDRPELKAVLEYMRPGDIGDVIDNLKVGRTAFYRYFPPERIRELRNQA